MTLFLYNVFDQTQVTLSSSAAKAFNPAWVDDATLAYNDPGGNGRVTVILP